MNNTLIKHHVGKFSITDENGSLNFLSKIETTSTYIDALFFVEYYPFDKSKNSISMLFNGVELRTLANQLNELLYGSIQSYTKHTGGSSNVATLNIGIIERYASFSFKRGAVEHKFRPEINLLSGLSKQIEQLVDISMDACYKTQQFAERKKKKLKGTQHA